MNDDVTLLAADLAGARAPHAQGSSHVLIVLGGSSGERRIPIGRGTTLVGRTPPCNIILGGGSVSRQHCKLELVGDQVTISDLGSTNGTFVDGRRISGSVGLSHGAALQIGTYTLNYERRTAKEVGEALASDREIQGARAYVNMLLPEPILSGPVRVNWLYLPCAKLSGNAFGYRFVSPNQFVGFMIDVAGMGTEAAMHAVAVLNWFRQSAIPHVDFRDPSSVLAQLNKTFHRDHYRGLFFSIWYFVFQVDVRVLHYASAGNLLGLVKPTKESGFTALKGNNPAIGLEPGGSFETLSQEVERGSSLSLLSDSACEIVERAEPDDFGQLVQAETVLGVPEPLILHNAVKRAAGLQALEGDFSAVVFDF